LNGFCGTIIPVFRLSEKSQGVKQNEKGLCHGRWEKKARIVPEKKIKNPAEGGIFGQTDSLTA